MARPIDKSLILNAFELIKSGLTQEQACASVGISVYTLRRQCKKLGIDSSNGRFDHPVEKIISDYASGVSELKLSKIYGIARGTVAKILLDNGIQRRNGSQASYIRMAKMSPEDRKKLVAPAHAAAKGRHEAKETGIKRALTREKCFPRVGPGEETLYHRLYKLGFKPIRQKAIDIYNIDIAIGSIAVEVSIGTVKFLGRASNQIKRIKKLSDCGYFVICINARTLEDFLFNINKIVADIQRACTNPPSTRQYWVIRSSFKEFSITRLDNGKFSAIKTPKEFLYRVSEINL